VIFSVVVIVTESDAGDAVQVVEGQDEVLQWSPAGEAHRSTHLLFAGFSVNLRASHA
jgi:hypothetical protein